ncbi:hypothetical protein SAMN05192583_0604 [Sphingomonas gellani]|uniref:Uncharacterized protein n=1 Tax=Sphingomonas gellani TaxID=1166340 RepID=A0A1H7ZAU9_9SPHN|nr:hypothetical protein SAMN05192583_0604 [Sphingomonas gellani]
MGERPACGACGAKLRSDKYRTDDDGFTACLPCFPVSNLPADADRFMGGPCYAKDASIMASTTDEGEGG